MHNCQDMDPALIPILEETLGGSKYWAIEQFAGTPKTSDNALEMLWKESSQAEWCIRCAACNYENYPSLDLDLDRMIGPYSDRIGKDTYGTICAKCQRMVDPRSGRWRHRYPERVTRFPGYHVPQIIMPLHYANHERWMLLLAKREGRFNCGPNVFYNEVCGETYDDNTSLVSAADLMKAGCLPWENNLEQALAHRHEYGDLLLSADWGGGGLKGGKTVTSWTVYTVMGWSNQGTIDVLYSFRSLTPHDAERESVILLDLLRKFKISLFVHDFNGAGRYREHAVVDSGWPYERIAPMWYVGSMANHIVKLVPESDMAPRTIYRVDKPRSLSITCGEIRKQRIRFFKYDFKNPGDPGVMHDFLSLVEDKTDSRIGRDIYTIIRKSNQPDDFAHTVNMGACALWYQSGNWPDLSIASKYEIPDNVFDYLNTGWRGN